MIGVRQHRQPVDLGHGLFKEFDPFAAISRERNVRPVKFPPGRARLAAKPSSTGSPLIANRTGISRAPLIARMAGPLDTMKATFDCVSSVTAARRSSRLRV